MNILTQKYIARLAVVTAVMYLIFGFDRVGEQNEREREEGRMIEM